MYERVFTRSVHQPLVYAFGVPTTRLRVWCTPEALTNQGEVASVYRPRSLLQYNRQSPSKQAYDTTCISCPWIRLACTIKLVQTLISERAQISNHSIPPRAIFNSDHPFRLLVQPARRSEVGDCGPITNFIYLFKS